MLAVATCRMASAVARASGRAARRRWRRAARAWSMSSFISPPRRPLGADDAEAAIGVGDRRLGAAAAVAGRARARRRRCAGPTLSTPSASSQAIEPPPAPMDDTSTAGMKTGKSPTVFSVDVGGPRRLTTAISALVPPMSRRDQLVVADHAAEKAAPMTPDAGAGQQRLDRPARRRPRRLMTPPFDLVEKTRQVMPACAVCFASVSK